MGPSAYDIATLTDSPELVGEITNTRVFHFANSLLGVAGEFLIAKGLWNLNTGEDIYNLPLGLAMVGVNKLLDKRLGSKVRQKLKALYLANTLSLHPWVSDQMKSNAINQDKIPPFHIKPTVINDGIESINKPPIISRYMRMLLDPISFAISSSGHLPLSVSVLSGIASIASVLGGKVLQPKRNELDSEHITIRDSIGSVARFGFTNVLDKIKERYFINMEGYVSHDKQIGNIGALPLISAAVHLIATMGDVTRWPGIINFYLRGNLSQVATNVEIIRDSAFYRIPGRVIHSLANFIRENGEILVLPRNWDKWRLTQPTLEEIPELDEDVVAQFLNFSAPFSGVHVKFNLTLKKNQVTLAPFPSGSGKTTAFLAALGLTTHSGELYLKTAQGTRNLREMTREEIAKFISHISSEYGVDPDSRIIDYYRELHFREFLEKCKEENRMPTENELSIFTYQDTSIEMQLSLAYHRLVQKGVKMQSHKYYGLNRDGSTFNPSENIIGEISLEEFEYLCKIRTERYCTVQEILESFGDFMRGVTPDRAPDNLSRGQIYTAMMSPHIYDDITVLVLDEVFSAIDKESLPQLLRQVFSLTTKFGISVVIINHGHQDIIERIANEFPMSNFQSIKTSVDNPDGSSAT